MQYASAFKPYIKYKCHVFGIFSTRGKKNETNRRENVDVDKYISRPTIELKRCHRYADALDQWPDSIEILLYLCFDWSTENGWIKIVSQMSLNSLMAIANGCEIVNVVESTGKLCNFDT